MSAKRVPTGAVLALLLGVVDLFFLNLYVSPKVFATDDGGEVVAVAPTPSPPANTRLEPSTTPPPRQPSASPDAGAAATGPANPPSNPPTDPPSGPTGDPPTDPTTDRPGDPPADPPTGPTGDPPDGPNDTPPVAPATDFKPAVHRMYFSQNRATIKSKHKKILDSAVTHLQQSPAAIAVVEAWADASETKYGLPFLIKRRMNKVVRYLQDQGIAADRIRTVNHGAGKSEDVFVNRRVRLRVEMP